jgi:hypothetical protein
LEEIRRYGYVPPNREKVIPKGGLMYREGEELYFGPA